jgi:hypothetical protein
VLASHNSFLVKYARPWFTSQSNKALATAPFESKAICRYPKPE